MIDTVYLRLVALRALLDHVTPDIRAVCVKEENEDIVTTFFCDGPYSEELEDSAYVATTEIISSLPWGENGYSRMIDTQLICLEYPKKLPLFKHLVYLRYEPDCQVYKNMVAEEVFPLVDSPNLRLAGMRALLGRVTPNLRGATIYEEDKTIFLHFYYDGPISDLSHQLIIGALSEIKSDFQSADESQKKHFDFKLDRVDFPKKISWKSDCLYARYEASQEP